jgi:hypothetical protein
MAKTYDDAHGATWEAYLGKVEPHAGVLPLIFHCTSNPSNGWRVVEVPADEFGAEDRVSRLSDDELADLFGRAQPFDYTHDPKSKENTVGDTPLR